ncbi:MAG: hypothetical protein V2I33_17415 [Kangiellaceae bacterium]|jgi:hypothetical protein|nr:hypothetical protein [Kangiellaceae bacterium]
MADAREEPNQLELQALIDRNNGAMVWMRRKEEADVAFEQLGYDEEPMELGYVAAKAATEHPTPKPSLEMQRLQTHVSKLEAKIGQSRPRSSSREEVHKENPESFKGIEG